jgi:hypothetical protein
MLKIFGFSLAALLLSLILANVCDKIKPKRERRPTLWEPPEAVPGETMDRKLRIVRHDLLTVIGVCEHCNTEFLAESEPNVEFAFDAHECRLTDS